MMQSVAMLELLLCWLFWSLAFLKPRSQAKGQKMVASAPVSRWGIFLVMAGFACIWAYVRPAGFEKGLFALIASMILGPLSVALAWWSTRHLGKQWRYQAALAENHELIRTGPYRWIRHPIYASMLGMLLATGAAWTWWPMTIAALVFFLLGTEIRIRAEDSLLATRFQGAFAEYKAKTRAYLPFLR